MELIDEAHLGAPDAGAGMVVHRRAIVAVDQHLTAVRCLEQAGDVEQRRLTGAGRTDESHGLPRQQRGAGSVEHMDRPLALMEGATEPDQLEHGYRLSGSVLHLGPHS